jgi:hypothetical protein
MSLAKVTFIKSIKVRRYGLCGCVAACCIKSMVVCVLCAMQSETLHSTHTSYTYDIECFLLYQLLYMPMLIPFAVK